MYIIACIPSEVGPLRSFMKHYTPEELDRIATLGYTPEVTHEHVVGLRCYTCQPYSRDSR